MPVLIGTSRFGSTASFYAKFRSRYPAALLDEIATRCGLDGTGRLLDLGCGPAFIAIAMAPHFSEVVGMDPAPEMLEVAAREAAAAHVPVTLIHGSSADLGQHLGRFRMAAMGRSFHWMDRDATLVALDELIEPNGAVAVLGEHHTNAPENSFKPVWDSIIKKWAPKHTRRARSGSVLTGKVTKQFCVARLSAVSSAWPRCPGARPASKSSLGARTRSPSRRSRPWVTT